MEPRLLVVSSYPPKGVIHAKATVGVASYTKNTLLSLLPLLKSHFKTSRRSHSGKPKAHPESQSLLDSGQGTYRMFTFQARMTGLEKASITVLAEILPGEEKHYEDNGITVHRMWKRNSLLIFPLLLWEIFQKHKATKHVLIEFELAMFGSPLATIPFPFFVMLLRLLGKDITIVVHQVIANINELSEHVHIKPYTWQVYMFNVLIAMFYPLLLFATDRAIVFEESLKDRLLGFGRKAKIIVISHAVEQFNVRVDKSKARTALGIPNNQFVILYFGYLAWYKGADWLAEIWGKVSPSNLRLIIAGGPNPNHINKLYYKQYVAQIEQTCKQHGITLTGFVEEDKIPLYFQAADLVVFPYRILMSASGPLSIALSFQKPFLVSTSLSPMFATKDWEESMGECNMSENELLFTLDDSFFEKVSGAKNNPESLKKLSMFSKTLAKKRSWKIIGRRYYEAIFAKA